MEKNKNFTYVIHSFMLGLGFKGSELAIYAVLYSYTKGEKGLFYGSQKTLAEQTSLSERTVSRALKSFYERNLIEKCEIDGKKGIRCVERKLNPVKTTVVNEESEIKDSQYTTEELLKRFYGYRLEYAIKPKIERLYLLDGEVIMSVEQLHHLASLIALDDLYVYMKKIEIIKKRNDRDNYFVTPHNHYKLIRNWIREDNSI